jgi:hypothetical protein
MASIRKPPSQSLWQSCPLAITENESIILSDSAHRLFFCLVSSANSIKHHFYFILLFRGGRRALEVGTHARKVQRFTGLFILYCRHSTWTTAECVRYYIISPYNKHPMSKASPHKYHFLFVICILLRDGKEALVPLCLFPRHCRPKLIQTVQGYIYLL